MKLNCYIFRRKADAVDESTRTFPLRGSRSLSVRKPSTYFH